MSSRRIVVIILYFLFNSRVNSSKNEISWSLNPDCDLYPSCGDIINSSSVTFVDVKTTTKSDDYNFHWMWSTLGYPTLEWAYIPEYDRLHLDWNMLLRGDDSDIRDSVYYGTREPVHSSSLMMYSLIEFNDTKENGKLDREFDPHRSYPLNNFIWTRKVLENSSEFGLRIQFIGSNYMGSLNESLSGVINVTLSTYANNGYGPWFPRLSHNSNVTEVDIQLMDLQTNSGYIGQRFALDLYVVNTNARRNTTIIKTKIPTIDDEHTPGVFMTEHLTIPGKNSNFQSYIRWKPVVYTKPVRDITDSTDVNYDVAMDVRNPALNLNHSLLYAIYGYDLNNLFIKNIHISFGKKNDGFYGKTNYNSWTFTFGNGRPDKDEISVLLTTFLFTLGCITIVVSVLLALILYFKDHFLKDRSSYTEI